MPTLNQGQYLEKSVLSVLDQRYSNLEFIVIDGGSTDHTLDVLKTYRTHMAYFESCPDGGQSHALNKGFFRATGELLGWLNSDDVLAPGALTHVAQKFQEERGNQVGAIVGLGDIVDEEGRVFFAPPLPTITFESLLNWNNGTNFMQPSCFFTREAWEQCGPLDESLHFCMDLDLWMKIAKRFVFCTTHELLSHSLTHDSAKTRAFAERSLMEQAVVFIRHGREDAALDHLYRLADQYAKTRNELTMLLKSTEFAAEFLNATAELEGALRRERALMDEIHQIRSRKIVRLVEFGRSLLAKLTATS